MSPKSRLLSASLLAVGAASLTGCAMMREIASPFKTYHGIANSKRLSMDTIKARLKPFEAKHDLKIKKDFVDGVEYEKVIYFSGGSGGTPTTCRLVVYTYLDTIHAFVNPCRMYKSTKTGWTDTLRIQNAGDQQVILDEIYYRYLDPTNDSAAIILDRSHADQIIGEEDELKLVLAKKRLFKE